ncbi:heme O synthase-like polyprenyltransferase [Salirhabdus euzebyi]|uniref:Heme O synthase-like polyprenyltransferase n=1 Tax=Salirhabdus euzebyi TaxID=394506 RepID=A0A841Q5J6_9BACI|nr:tripartite tricarboxylate transporter TctB family protein [Salirhabdus euzebyi]MBB6453670.1 heme O synthase-like polyprenyltransferase [Salirhabdus euzebyi]
MQRVNHDIVSSIIFIFVAAFALWETRGLSEMSYVFPRTAGIILLVCSIIFFIKSIIKKEDKKAFDDINKRKVMVMSLGMIGYLIVIGLVGFLIASIIYIWAFCFYLQRDEKEKSNKSKMLHAGITAFGVSIFFFVLFKFVFAVPLPPGIFFGG